MSIAIQNIPMQELHNVSKPVGMSWEYFLLNKWGLFGIAGTALTGLSIPLDGQTGTMTGLAGLLVVLITVYQKWREDRRTQENHVIKIGLIKKVTSGEIKMDDEIKDAIIKHFMDK